MKLYLGADHRGFQLKEQLKEWLQELVEKKLLDEVVDLGNTEYDPADDYPDYSLVVAEAVAKIGNSEEAKGVVICGSGVGVTIAGNKIDGARVAGVSSIEETMLARQDDDLNVLAIGADFVSFAKAQALITSFLRTEFEDSERHVRRLNKIKKYEQEN
jgi:ribose 5-phosphate isomerase B